MSLRINHNLSAVNAHRNVVNNSNAQSKTMEKLSSGLKIPGPEYLRIFTDFNEQKFSRSLVKQM